MNLDTAREIIKDKMNISFSFVYKGPRNQIEKFNGKIVKCFPSVFVIVTEENVTKTFSYNDFIIKNLKIISCK